MKDWLLEICADSAESALAAQRGGAGRIELCANLIIGGTTPTKSLFLQVKKLISIPIRVLIRPRFGDFLYNNYEKEQILSDIKLFKGLGADGVVIGALNQDGDLDIDFLKKCLQATGEMKLTCHRAFDMCSNPAKALEELISLGVDCVLTSGCETNAVKGAACIAALEAQSAGRIHIMAGAGVASDCIRELYIKTGVRYFHMSARCEYTSAMKYRNPRVNMGFAGVSEYSLWKTDEEKVREAAYLLYFLIHLSDEDIRTASEGALEDCASQAAFIRSSEAVKELPEEKFLQYAAFPRVNDEVLSKCRTQFWREICSFAEQNSEVKTLLGLRQDETLKIESLGTEQLAQLVNLWCASEVCYRFNDHSTRSAMDIYESGYGRCGEESVFCVNALRSAGIAARQVYAPFWSHCDDNHAWVEVLIAGAWHFFGACEPQVLLDRGWFNHAASRAMMVHSREFLEEGNQLLHPQTARYARTKDIAVRVLKDGKSAGAGIMVSFYVVNFCHFSIIAQRTTDESGEVYLPVGYGDLFCTAASDGLLAEGFLLENERALSLSLKEPRKESDWESFVFNAPKDCARIQTDDESTKLRSEELRGWLKEAAERRNVKSEAYDLEHSQKKSEKYCMSDVKSLSAEEQVKVNISCDYKPSPVYMQDYYIQRIEKDGYKDCAAQDILLSGCSCFLTPGSYQVMTAIRRSNGALLCARKLFTVKKMCETEAPAEASKAGETALKLELKRCTIDIGSDECDFTLPDSKICFKNTNKCESVFISDITNNKMCITVWVDIAQEPTEHILNELIENADVINDKNIKILIISDASQSVKNVTMRRLEEACNTNIRFAYADFSEQLEPQARSVFADPNGLPLVVLTDRSLHCIFACSGYRVGSIAQLICLCK